MTFIPETLLKSFDQFPVCPKLKQLELITDPVDGSPLCYIPIIKACPFLHKFVLKLQHYLAHKKRKLSEVEACPHLHLKIIEVSGFIGTPWEFLADKKIKKARENAVKNLGPFLKPGVDLVIL